MLQVHIHPNDFQYFGITSKKDKDFIFSQIEELKKYDLKQEYFSDFIIIPIDGGKNTDEFYYITIPLFSKDKQTSIFVFGNISRFSNFGKIIIFSKENNKCIQTEKGQMWIDM